MKIQVLGNIKFKVLLIYLNINLKLGKQIEKHNKKMRIQVLNLSL